MAVLGLVAAAVGVVLVLRPFTSLTVLVILVAAGLVISGASSLARWHRRRGPWPDLLIGVVSIVAGIAVAVWPGITTEVLANLVGLAMVVVRRPRRRRRDPGCGRRPPHRGARRAGHRGVRRAGLHVARRHRARRRRRVRRPPRAPRPGGRVGGVARSVTRAASRRRARRVGRAWRLTGSIVALVARPRARRVQRVAEQRSSGRRRVLHPTRRGAGDAGCAAARRPVQVVGPRLGRGVADPLHDDAPGRRPRCRQRAGGGAASTGRTSRRRSSPGPTGPPGSPGRARRRCSRTRSRPARSTPSTTSSTTAGSSSPPTTSGSGRRGRTRT